MNIRSTLSYRILLIIFFLRDTLLCREKETKVTAHVTKSRFVLIPSHVGIYNNQFVLSDYIDLEQFRNILLREVAQLKSDLK